MFSHLLRVARAPFLALPVVLALSAWAACAHDGVQPAAGWGWSVLALAGVTAAHVAVNVLNEWSDTFYSGIDLKNPHRTQFNGGSGALPEGKLSSRFTLAFGIGALVVAVAIGTTLMLRIGAAEILPISALGGLAVVGYTDLFARVYLGEVVAGLGLGSLPVLGFAAVQQPPPTVSLLLTQTSPPSAVSVAALVAGLLTFNLLLLNEFPDLAVDRKGGRRNLIMLLGVRAAAAVYLIVALAVPTTLLVAVFYYAALPRTALFSLLPSAIFLPTLARWAAQTAFGAGRDPHRAASATSIPPTDALGANVAFTLLTNATLALGVFAGQFL